MGKRRIFYNTVMLAAGFITIILAISLGEITVSDLINILPPVLIFALSANLFYKLGCITQIVCQKLIPQKDFVQKAGPILFVSGTSFSVFFTSPIDIAIVIAFFF